MRNLVFVSALVSAVALSGAAFAQSSTTTPKGPTGSMAEQQKQSQQKPGRQSVLTVSELKQNLQQAGFSDINVLEDAFVVQAKTKDGNPIMMTIGPNGMSALEAINPGKAAQERTGDSESSSLATPAAKPNQQ